MRIAGLPPAAVLALSVLRHDLGFSALPGVRRHAVEEDELRQWLSHHGLSAAYLHAHQRSGLRRHTAAFLSDLEALGRGTYGRNMVLFSEYRRLREACAKRGIPVMALKGVPALVGLHGLDLSRRTMADLDILVNPSQEASLLALLEDLGYEKSGWTVGDFLGDAARHAFPRVHRKRQTAVEVHRRIDFAFPVLGRGHSPDPFQDAREVDVDGFPALLPSWTTWCLQWAVHTAYADAYLGKARDLYDMALLLARHGREVSWGDVIDPRRTPYLLRPLKACLDGVSALFGATLPHPWQIELARLGGLSWPARAPLDSLRHGTLVLEDLQKRLPLSLLAPLSTVAHVPDRFPLVLAEYARMYFFPSDKTLDAHYGRGSRWGRLARRALDVVRVLAKRTSAKNLGTGGRTT